MLLLALHLIVSSVACFIIVCLLTCFKELECRYCLGFISIVVLLLFCVCDKPSFILLYPFLWPGILCKELISKVSKCFRPNEVSNTSYHFHRIQSPLPWLLYFFILSSNTRLRPIMTAKLSLGSLLSSCTIWLLKTVIKVISDCYKYQ